MDEAKEDIQRMMEGLRNKVSRLTEALLVPWGYIREETPLLPPMWKH